jgi:uncharacterized membrane protein (DUF4010 family)
MDTVELFQRLSVGLAIGLLIGLERGWQSREESEGERAAGLRTHALGALLGGVWAAIALPFGAGGVAALGLAFVAFAAAAILFRYRETEHDQTFGATTVVASMLAFALGAFAVLGDIEIAAAAGVAATGLLALKTLLHSWVQRLTWAELRSILVLLAMSCIFLPVLPRRPIDPWGAVDPFAIWLLTVMIAAISFAGYVAVKLAGPERGVAVAGFAGGLASSTSVTLTMARLARERPAESGLLAAGALFANCVMALRLLAIVGLVQPELTLALGAPLVAIGVVFGVAGALCMAHAVSSTDKRERLTLDNPLDLGAVMKFGALLAVVMILAKLAVTVWDGRGIYALAMISGAADVDAISLSLARLDHQSLGTDTIVIAILLAVAANTVMKVGMSWLVGGAGIAWRLALGSTLAFVAGWFALTTIHLV